MMLNVDFCFWKIRTKTVDRVLVYVGKSKSPLYAVQVSNGGQRDMVGRRNFTVPVSSVAR